MMTVLWIILWSAIAATVAWGLTLRGAAAATAAEREAAQREIRQWQDRAVRARLRADQLERELASFSEGCRQGREDVLSIVPMLLAANGHQAPCVCQSATGGTR
jgi:hypothetical protein